jgi:hypothetical protein
MRTTVPPPGWLLPFPLGLIGSGRDRPVSGTGMEARS